MAEVLLSDYLAYVFSEISRARDMADRYSKEIALGYAKDDVLRHFAVPRFKLSKLDLTMPMLVSGLQVTSLMRFQMNREEFGAFIFGKITGLVAAVRAVKPDAHRDRGFNAEGIEPLLGVFYQQLLALPDPSRPEDVVRGNWSGIAAHAFAINEVPSESTRLKAVADLLSRALLELIDAIKGKTSVRKATIEQLLVNPQTHVVKDGSNDASVFTIKAELIEEGLLVKRVADERTGIESTVVEFE